MSFPSSIRQFVSHGAALRSRPTVAALPTFRRTFSTTPARFSSSSSLPPLIVSPSDALSYPGRKVILDATWLYDQPTRSAHKEYLTRRLPGARWWDLEGVSEPGPLTLMFPSPERFARFAGEAGIGKEDHVFVYDGEGVFSAPRTVFTFKQYGQNVSLIDGGLPRAVAEGIELEKGAPPAFEKTDYPVPTVEPESVVDYSTVSSLISRDSFTRPEVLLDARPISSYSEGHIPTSRNLDFPSLLAEDPAGFRRYRTKEDAKRYIVEVLGEETAEAVLRGERQVVNTCGGGLTAAIVWAQLQALGIDSKLYDESWSGYSLRPSALKATGADGSAVDFVNSFFLKTLFQPDDARAAEALETELAEDAEININGSLLTSFQFRSFILSTFRPSSTARILSITDLNISPLPSPSSSSSSSSIAEDGTGLVAQVTKYVTVAKEGEKKGEEVRQTAATIVRVERDGEGGARKVKALTELATEDK
ncbi:hypothetical protein JCM8547_002614 [Rhodosporidiobolus lusitaniae]